MDIKKIIKEIYEEVFKEDVGDKYLKRKFNIGGEFDEFEKKYLSQQHDKGVVYSDGDWKLIKNPNSLKNIGEKARGIIMGNGDLYIESYSGIKIHNDILGILNKIGVLDHIPQRNWGKKSPKETGFLTVQRYRNSPYISIGESNRYIYDIGDYKDNIKDYQDFMDKAKEKNPNMNFETKLVGTKSPIKTSGENLMNETYLK